MIWNQVRKPGNRYDWIKWARCLNEWQALNLNDTQSNKKSIRKLSDWKDACVEFVTPLPTFLFELLSPLFSFSHFSFTLSTWTFAPLHSFNPYSLPYTICSIIAEHPPILHPGVVDSLYMKLHLSLLHHPIPRQQALTIPILFWRSRLLLLPRPPVPIRLSTSYTSKWT